MAMTSVSRILKLIHSIEQWILFTEYSNCRPTYINHQDPNDSDVS
jgi:hypothetical protein